MMREELISHLIKLPPDAEVVVQLGRILVDILGADYVGERDSIVLILEPDDVSDVLAHRAKDGFSTSCSQLRRRCRTTDQ